MTSRSKLAALAVVSLAISLPGVTKAQSSPRDPKQTRDLLDGRRFVFRDDDIVVSYQTNDSQFGPAGLFSNLYPATYGGIPTSPSLNGDPFGFANPQGQPGNRNVGVSLARLYNSTNDISITVGSGFDWTVLLKNAATGNFSSSQLTHETPSFGTTEIQVITGDFTGDGFADAFVFYSSTVTDSNNPSHVTIKFGARVGTAVDVNTVDSGLRFGGEQPYGNDSVSNPAGLYPLVLSETAVAGDFNGDGRDEIAMLMSDRKTIQFFSVDPATLSIKPLTSIVLPTALNTTAGLCAGHFRNSISQGNASYDELVAIGGNINNAFTNYIYPVAMAPGGNSALAPSVLPPYTFFGSFLSQIEAKPAALANWDANANVQIVIGYSANNQQAWIEVGQFDQNFVYSMISQTLANQIGINLLPQCITGLAIGDFDQHNADGSYNPSQMIATYFSLGSACGAAPPGGTTYVQMWTQSSGALTNVTNAPDLVPSGATGAQLAIGDTQGRSLMLGSPERVYVEDQIQPDIVLGLPPMHVDWVAPNTDDWDSNNNPSCTASNVPCTFNLTVLPSVSATNQHAFSSGFNFSSTATNSLKRQSTTSWSLAVKETASAKFTVGVPLEDETTVSIKNQAQFVHDNVVAKNFETTSSQTDSVNSTTGFSDHAFFTERSHFIFYYPVIGKVACSVTTTHCTLPVYMTFSVPVANEITDLDTTKQEWYQPIQEPGNVLSYPWSQSLLQSQIGSKMAVLSPTNPISCRGTDTSDSSYLINWSSSQTSSQSVGITNAFSDELSVSVSQSAGIAGIDGGSYSFGLDIKGSTSLKTLNVGTQGLGASEGMIVQKPGFDSSIFLCCSYEFSNFIFGLQTPTDQQITVNDPTTNQPADVQQNGPLFSQFIADVSSVNPGACGGGSTWWVDTYNLPDVGVNHPARWSWDRIQEKVSFNFPDQTGNVTPDNDFFYWMKGFYITQGDDPSPTSGTVLEAQAGDPVSLTARVYNFSLADMDAPFLSQPAAGVHVRFFGQTFCSSGSASETSCQQPGGGFCAPGTLCGPAFQIGTDQVIAPIPGYQNASGSPNWVLVTVPFDTTNYANDYLVFSVVTWMEDRNGNKVTEMPDHGLLSTFSKGANYSQIIQVPVEQHSNNVGMYPLQSPFHVAPKGSQIDPNDSTPSSQLGSSPNALRSVEVFPSQPAFLEKDTKISANIAAGAAATHRVTINYYDGDPAAGGKLFDRQSLATIPADGVARTRTFFQPSSCGVHTIYTVAKTQGSDPVAGRASMHVTIDLASVLQDMVDVTQTLKIASLHTKRRMTQLLGGAGNGNLQGLNEYVTLLKAQGSVVPERTVNKLLGEVDAILTCQGR